MTDIASFETPEITVMKMKKSQGADYFVHIEVQGRVLTPHVFSERYKAEYEAAYYRHVFLGTERPHILAFSETSHPNDPD